MPLSNTEKSRAWRAANPERSKEIQRLARLRNLEKHRERDRVRGKKEYARRAAYFIEWVATNKDRRDSQKRRWADRNPERVAIYSAKNLIAATTGLARRDIPNDLAEAKVLQLRVWRAARRAQAIEARRAETQGGSVHESAVAASDAPESPQP